MTENCITSGLYWCSLAESWFFCLSLAVLHSLNRNWNTLLSETSPLANNPLYSLSSSLGLKSTSPSIPGISSLDYSIHLRNTSLRQSFLLRTVIRCVCYLIFGCTRDGERYVIMSQQPLWRGLPPLEAWRLSLASPWLILKKLWRCCQHLQHGLPSLVLRYSSPVIKSPAQ